jgi:Ca2+-binding RTX toxin-like protein
MLDKVLIGGVIAVVVLVVAGGYFYFGTEGQLGPKKWDPSQEEPANPKQPSDPGGKGGGGGGGGGATGGGSGAKAPSPPCPPGYVPIKPAALIGGVPISLTAQAAQYQYDQTEPPAAPKESSECKANTIEGTNKADTIDGTKKADLILGGDGDDKIETGLGNDKIEAGPGKDTINAGLGNNTIQAGLGNDTIHTIVIWHAKNPSRMVFLKQRTKCGPGLDDLLVYHRRAKAGYMKYFGKIDVGRSEVIHPPDCENVKPPPKKPSRIKPKDRPEG